MRYRRTWNNEADEAEVEKFGMTYLSSSAPGYVFPTGKGLFTAVANSD